MNLRIKESLIIIVISIWIFSLLGPSFIFLPIIILLILIKISIKKIKKKKIIKEVHEKYSSNKKVVFFIYSDSKKWKKYFENELIPKIKNKLILCNWSKKHEKGWNENLLEFRIWKYFLPKQYFYPCAIVFLPSGKIKIFEFYKAYLKKIKSGKIEYEKLEKEFFEFIKS